MMVMMIYNDDDKKIYIFLYSINYDKLIFVICKFHYMQLLNKIYMNKIDYNFIHCYHLFLLTMRLRERKDKTEFS